MYATTARSTAATMRWQCYYWWEMLTSTQWPNACVCHVKLFFNVRTIEMNTVFALDCCDENSTHARHTHADVRSMAAAATATAPIPIFVFVFFFIYFTNVFTTKWLVLTGGNSDSLKDWASGARNREREWCVCVRDREKKRRKWKRNDEKSERKSRRAEK